MVKSWFTAEGSKSIGRYDPASGKLDWSMGTGQDRTHMIYVTDRWQKNIYHECFVRNRKHFQDTLIQPGKMAPPEQDHTKNGLKPLFRFQEALKDLMYHPMANDCGLQPVKME